jgi:hypothetical protein
MVLWYSHSLLRSALSSVRPVQLGQHWLAALANKSGFELLWDTQFAGNVNLADMKSRTTTLRPSITDRSKTPCSR